MQHEDTTCKGTKDGSDIKFMRIKGSQVDSIIAAYGLPFMQRVAKAFGGEEIKVPASRSLHPGHRLVVKLGKSDAECLCNLFAGELISIPKGYTSARTDYLIAAVQAAKPVHEMASELGVTMRHIRRLLYNLGLKSQYRLPSRRHIDAKIWDHRQNIVREFLAGKIGRTEAVGRLAIPDDLFSELVARYHEKGDVLPRHIRALRAGPVPPAVSNGGLTGLPPFSGTPLHPASENRASGP